LVTTPISRTLGAFAAPTALPLADFDAVNERVSQQAVHDKDLWHGFASAWNGVAYRLRAALEHASSFALAISASSAPPPNERYRQDHDLFGFVISAISALECFHFAAHCMGSLLDPGLFRLTRPADLKFYPRDVRDRFQQAFPGDSLSVAIAACLSAPEYAQLNDLRNVLGHRGTPPRLHLLSTGTDQPSAIPSNVADLASRWRYDFPLKPGCLDSYTIWLQRSVRELIIAAASFASARL
jgi:hypothetical protein